MSKEELDKLSVMLRMLNGEVNVIEHMEAEGQREVVNNVMLARNMKPEKEEWEKLGFVFEDIPGDDLLCKAVLPAGWELVATDHPMWNDLIDEKGNQRGSMFYKAAFYDRDAFMRLERRYGIGTNYSDDLSIREIYFGNQDEKLFVAGQIQITKNDTREERLEKYKQEEKLKRMAIKFGDEYYPDWQDSLAYWDNEKRLTNSK